MAIAMSSGSEDNPSVSPEDSGDDRASAPTMALSLSGAETPVMWKGYRVFEEIASGGMATVHLAAAPGRKAAEPQFVAIKKMHAHFARDPDFSSMFLDEAMVAKRIAHENVVATIDVVQDGEELLLVLELVEGESLSKILKGITLRKERVPQAIASAVVIDMLRGLHAAHEATSEDGEPLMIVHRDVSPHNVVVGTDGLARVLDFGVAKARGRVQQTQKGQLKGKLAYMSPEQARGKAVDRRSDLFASGIVLWELLAGHRLYDQDNEAALLVALISELPGTLSTKYPALEPFDELVQKALEQDPAERYETAFEMAEAVGKAIAPAGRDEVAAWVRKEAHVTLRRRDGLMARARELLLQTEAAKQQHPAPAAAAPVRPPALSELSWDLSTTTNEDPEKPGLARAPKLETKVPRLLDPVGPPRRPLSPPLRPAASAKPTREVDTIQAEPSTIDQSSDASFNDRDSEEPEATLPLYSPPQEYLERWRRAADAESAPAGATTETHGEPNRIGHALHATAAPSPPSGPGLPPPSSGNYPRGAPPYAFETMRLSEPPEVRAEGVASQVTSVTLTTTGVPPPPPLSPDQVRRLTIAGASSAGLVFLAAMGLLALFGGKPGDNSQRAAALSGAGLVSSQAASAAALADPGKTPSLPVAPATSSSSEVPTSASAASSASSAPPAPPPPRPVTAPPPTTASWMAPPPNRQPTKAPTGKPNRK